MKNTNRKGFTIVELVIVIAVIAILAAVLIPTFVGLVNKANVAADTALIKNLNTALAADTDGCKTMHEALEAAAEYGYDVAKINAKGSNNEILWDSVNNVFCYFDSEKGEQGDITYIPDYNVATKPADVDYWVIASTPSEKYSTYLYDYEGNGVLEGVKTGLDVADCAITSITFDGANEVNIFTNGGLLAINNVNAEVYHYGTADEVVIRAVASESYHVYGKVTTIKVSEGRVVPEAGAEIKVLVVTDVATDKNVEIEVAEGAKVEAVVVADNTPTAVIDSIKAVIGGETVTTVPVADIENAVTGAALFAGGLGTKDDPYLIASVENMLNINKLYKSTYAYFEVIDSVEAIDFGGMAHEINLCGNFNGNGVVFNNVCGGLFRRTYGAVNAEKGVGAATVEDFTVNFTNSDSGVITWNYCKNLTMSDVTVHGYIENDSNLGSFFNLAGCGSQYNLDLVLDNCYSDATLVTTGSTAAGMIGHPYCSAESTITITNSKYTGHIYSPNLNSTHEINACGFNGKATRDGKEITASDVKIAADKAHEIKVNNGTNPDKYATFSTEKDDGCTKAVAMLIVAPNGNGITYIGGGYCGIYITEELTLSDTLTTSDIKYFDITSNGNATTSTGVSADGKTFNVVNSNYNTEIGYATVRIVQYDGNGNILSITVWNVAE